MNCYKCEWKGNAIGSAHSSCKHPACKTLVSDPELRLFALLAKAGRGSLPQFDVGLNIEANPHGIGRGWFNWPFDFDPVWLLSCDGFEEKT